MVNPYDPQSPAKPDYFGGRKEVLGMVKQRIEKAKVQKQSGGVLVQGYRGVGKTSLLNKIRSLEEPDPVFPSSNTLIIYRRLGKTTSEDELFQIINESIADEIHRRKTLLERARSAAERITSLSIMDISFDWNPTDLVSPFLKWQRLSESIRNADLVIIEIDDADYLSIEAIGALKTIVESRSSTPVLLVVSSGFDFEERLVNDYSPVARIFSGASFNIGEFSLDETREVLEKPLPADSNTRWLPDGVRKLHELSRGYPYLVQCLASASFVESGSIDPARVMASKEKSLDIAKVWLSQEMKEASDLDIIGFARIAENGVGPFKSSEISALGVSPPYVGRLVKLQVLKKINRGRYILNKSPMIAYYHLLRRNLKV